MNSILIVIAILSVVGLLIKPSRREFKPCKRKFDEADYHTPQWKALVKTVHRRDGYRCHFCPRRPGTAHHITYRDGVLCDPKWLLSVCWPCHNYIHYR
jgi:hypothetical protein